MNDICGEELWQQRQRLDAGELTPAELAAAHRQQIRRHPDINAFLRVNEDDTYTASDTPLSGLPIAHKDIFCAAGERVTCGSRILENFVSPYDSAVVENIRRAGMLTLGRTNMDEFAMGSSGEHSAYAVTRNPWDPGRVPGGSSSGSAAAVAARMTPAATATDTGGSIRQPASFCGVTGVKPTYGRVSRWGMVAFASSFDQGGVLAKSARDCALVLSAMAGFDERDSTSVNMPPENYARDLSAPLAGRVIGVPKQYFGDGLNDQVAECVQAAARQLQKQGAVLRDIELTATPHAIAAYYVLTCAEASSNLSRYDGIRYGRRETGDDLKDTYEKTRAAGFGREVKRRILIGAYMLSYGYYDAYYRRAMKVRTLIADDFARAFRDCDLILGPATPDIAFPIDAIADNDPVAMYLQDVYTVPVNLAGLPAMSVPCGFVEGMPVGMQLIGAPWQESLLLSVAHQYQQQTDFHRRVPPLVKT